MSKNHGHNNNKSAPQTDLFLHIFPGGFVGIDGRCNVAEMTRCNINYDKSFVTRGMATWNNVTMGMAKPVEALWRRCPATNLNRHCIG